MKKYNEEGVPNEEITRQRKKLMLHSIVNTVTNLGRYSAVQILVDTADTGVGVVPTCEEFGYEYPEKNLKGQNPLPPIYFIDDIVMNATNTASEVLALAKDLDWAKIYNNYIATPLSDEFKPDYIAYVEMMNELDYKLVDWSITGDSEENADNVRVVWADINYLHDDGIEFSRERVPIRLRLENGLWAIPYESIIHIMNKTID